ncbi:MAG TPA: HD domain-containing protein [Candidatus Tumulicola sp.]|nr:HD domain-containing protein [Candidatus Tumulicola sp.]
MQQPAIPIHPSLFETLRHDPDVLALIEKADNVAAALGYTDHGRRHVTLVAVTAARVLRELGHDEHACDLAAVSGLLHDIGNAAGRNTHAAAGALLAYQLLVARGVSTMDAAEVMAAIGNHDETELGVPVSAHSAALILADKADVHRSRVRTRDPQAFDIHDKVNFAVTKAELDVDGAEKMIALRLSVDEAIGTREDINALFNQRFAMSDAAARFLGCDFSVIVNGTTLR